jgi:folate-dependent phosphoribosylglycinamide formyltransferase PurN
VPNLGRPLRVVILSQEDALSIPRNVTRVAALPGIALLAVFTVDAKGSLVNRKRSFVRGFGWRQCARMAAVLVWAGLLDLMDRCLNYRLLCRKRSVRAAARRARVPYEVVRDVNSGGFLDHLTTLAPDIVLSFSAPCVFRPALLALPPLGCINLHCSVLPKYAGLLPSFWVLFYGEKRTGATVHFMDDKIDNGDILAQTTLSIPAGTTMVRLIEATKAAGGELVCDVLGRFRDGEEVPRLANRAEDGSYFGWPTVEQMREFRRRGGRFI